MRASLETTTLPVSSAALAVARSSQIAIASSGSPACLKAATPRSTRRA